ncbi:capsule biosynthesis protein CapB [Limnochorda pilosa]|uniref:Capsule biosynthesis protein CapB n=1 Tax=Limnochorda pilosa TaxID=1555112 RepID=A0A0K2SGZ1_LIMPI|nr:capsule biosynthesis protein CapB [Limnochorda pilosa]
MGGVASVVEVALLGAVAAGLGMAEQARLQRARAAVAVRVHVNGTRGKSTVTRLLAAALQASGARVLGKVTGTEARWLLPDGTEEPVRRGAGGATIREQARAVVRAARLGCDAAVLECMALRPELLWVSEHRMVRSTLGVITNVRDDHGDVMGRDRAEIARTLANTIPAGGLLVTGDAAAFPFFAEEARRRKSRAYLASPLDPARAPATLGAALAWHAPENLGVAMTAARLLGVDEPTAWRGFAAALVEPGTAAWTVGRLRDPGAGERSTVLLVDALAANDPDSFRRVMEGALAACPPAAGFELRVIYHHRADRSERAGRFGGRLPEVLRSVGSEHPARVWATGDRGGARLLGAGACQGPGAPGLLLARWGVEPGAGGGADEAPGGRPGEGSGGDPGSTRPHVVVVACGNTRGARSWQEGYGPWQPVPLGRAAGAGEPAAAEGGVAGG